MQGSPNTEPDNQYQARFGATSMDADDAVPKCVLTTVKPGDGTRYPTVGASLRVHYEGFLENGDKFDSSRERGRPFEFKLGAGQVIPGLDNNIPAMSVGQIAKIVIPPTLAYGVRGYPPIVPPNEILTFELELISFHAG